MRSLSSSLSNKREPTRLLYLEDAYIKEFSAGVLSTQKLNEQSKIILDQTAFYPAGGGQPTDTGTLRGANSETRIIDAKIENHQVVHITEEMKGTILLGEDVSGIIDWVRRYQLMRNHTLAHLMAEVVRQVTGLPMAVVGSAIDVDKARLDLAYKGGSMGPLLLEIQKVANQMIKENRPVEIKMMPRAEAEKSVARFHESLKTLPPQVQNVRIVEIKDWHACACGGTHVKSVWEIGSVTVLRRMSKGKGVERIEFTAKTS